MATKDSLHINSCKALLLLWLVIVGIGCQGQKTSDMTDNAKNKQFSCDVETGICDTTEEGKIEEFSIKKEEKVTLLYFTDPICSACWAIEPELKKFKLEYGDYVDIKYKMGGLLPKWEGFSDGGNGISKPSDVAGHWDEVGAYTKMSIDGDVWLEDPLASSYPPSIAFKAVQKQGEELALDFLRRIREMVFLEKKNITKHEYLVEAVQKVNGDTAQFLADYKNDKTTQSFYADLKESGEMGVRGFPTFILFGKDGKGYKISGTSGYANYVIALTKAYGKELQPKKVSYTEKELLEKYGYLATKEIAVILSQSETETIAALKKLVDRGEATEEIQKFSSFWRTKK